MPTSAIGKFQRNPKNILFNHVPEVQPYDCDVIIFCQDWFIHGNPFPTEIFRSSKKFITVLMDSSDGGHIISLKPEFRQFNYIFRTHACRFHTYPSNFIPWAFGLSNRILKETSEISQYTLRKKTIMVNYRTIGVQHSLRKCINREFLPKINQILPIDNFRNSINDYPLDHYDYLQWFQTGRRHHPTYYQHLKEVAACACFGGFFVNPWMKNQSSLVSRAFKNLIGKSSLKTNRIIQWDSWRLWESLSSGCVAFHVDFDRYGFQLPVMPENWVHYIGVDLFNISETIERLADEPNILEKVSNSGRSWSLQYYNPVATAKRFLKTISRQ